jgi:tetratricopeptide (TPR) repeat protein
MEDECGQWERLAGEFAEAEKYFQAANQYKQAASCYLDHVVEMTRKAAEYFHRYAEMTYEKGDHKTAAMAYFEAASQYRQVDEQATALTLFENAAREALEARLTETAAQSYLWAAHACHKLGNSEYFLTCADNMAKLYDKAAEEAVQDGKAERAVIDFSLAAMGFATIEKAPEAKKRIDRARRIVDKTTWDWLKTLLSFSQALTENRFDDAADLLKMFKQEETIQGVMDACLSILEEREKKRRKTGPKKS